MLCYQCLTQSQTGGGSNALLAVTVYQGLALCLGHLNITRGLPIEFGSERFGPVIPSSANFAPLGTPNSTMVDTQKDVQNVQLPHPRANEQQKDIKPSEINPSESEALLKEGVHETCENCDTYYEVHYQPDLPHCGCGAPLIDGACETTYDPDAYELLLERIRPS